MGPISPETNGRRTESPSKTETPDSSFLHLTEVAMDPLAWDDAEEIAELLNELYPDVDPLYDIRFSDLLDWVTKLDEFVGDPEESNEARLEVIQMAWNDLK
jgi:FeS assembly protein IscX